MNIIFIGAACLILLLSAPLILAAPNQTQTQSAFAQTSDWLLTVRVIDVPFGDSNVHISIKGPFGYNNFDNIANSPNPSDNFNMPGGQFPTGYRYQVCASSNVIGFFLPRCAYFIHGNSDETVTISLG